MKLKNRILSLLLAVCMIVTLFPVSAMAAGEATEATEATAAPVTGEDVAQGQSVPEALPQETEPAEEAGVTAKEIENPGVDLKQKQNTQPLDLPGEDETVRVIVVLEGKSLLDQGFTTAQISANGAQVASQVETMAQRQSNVLERIEALVDEPVQVKYNYNVAFSGMALEVPYGAVEQIRELPGVKAAVLSTRYELPENEAANTDVAEPSMYATKNSFGSALTWENLGYTGQGMRIAIIDTGLDLDHPSFAAAPQLTGDSLTVEEIAGVLESLNAYRQYADTSAVKLTAGKLYRSEKVPYAFNYVDSGLDVTHDHDNQGDHGTHVAGIAAANATEGTDVIGVAPDAQILVMKVFGVNGGAYTEDILAALEDCYRLNVDVVNLSLGSPAGFTDESDLINQVYSKILESDMIAAMAAGNSASAASMNGYGTDRNLTQDPDNGIVSSPATYIGATAVASVENSSLMLNYLVAGGEKIAYVDAGAIVFTSLAGKTLEYVMVPGYGAAGDYAGLDVEGKVAVVSRGALDFTVKQQNAYAAGAAACLVYDNVDGSLISMMDAGVLPNAFISKASGEILAANAKDGKGVLEVMPYEELTSVASPVAGQMSDFSSWGVTPDLQLSPDVTAPGGNIYSCLTDGKYGSMSGTSMASPHIAGMSALVLEYLRDRYELTDAQAHTVAEALIMSTAQPLVEPTGQLYSPRKQGSGSANVYSAVTSPAYLTVEGDTPKVSMGDDDNRTGVYEFSFQVNNLSAQPQSYALSGAALTDQVDLTYAGQGYTFMGETSRSLEAAISFRTKSGELSKQYDANGDGVTDMADVQYLLDGVNGLTTLTDGVKSAFDLTGDGVLDTADVQKLYELVQAGFTALDVVEVPANGTATVYVTVALSQADKAYMDEYYENGIYVDGFVRLYALNGNTVDLSLPFMGFYGDWSAARVFDSGWYYQGDEAEYNRYMNVLFTDYGADPSIMSNLGLNPYLLEPYDPAHNVLSPNGDGYLDKISEIYLGLMRGAELVDFTWTNEAGEELFYEWYPYARKSYYWNGYGVCMPMVYSNACDPYDFKDESGAYTVSNNEKVTLTIDAFLDDGDLDDGVAGEADLDERITVPVIIDTEAPKLYTDEIAYLYNPYTDGRRLEFYVSDNYDIAAVVPMTEAGVAYDYIPVDTKPGEKTLVSIDVSGYDATFRIAVCDYGCNETYYEISFAGERNVSFDSFYGYRRYSSPVIGGYLFTTDALNGWYSFQNPADMLQHTSQYESGDPAVAAAEYVDGYIIGVDVNSSIFTMKAGAWTRSKLGDLKIGKYFWNAKTYPALDMAFDYSTDTMYILADELNENEGSHLMTLDILTGAVTDLGVIEGVDHEKTQLLTLACDNGGALYSMDVSEGRLYIIDKETVTVTGVEAKSSYYPAYAQSMTVDHETDRLYWAAYQGSVGTSYFFEVDKTNGGLLSMAKPEDNCELTALFKPYDCGRELLPKDTQAAAITLSQATVYLTLGENTSLACLPSPYYAKLDQVTWASDDESVATVKDGAVNAVGVGTATITATMGEKSASCQVHVNNVTGELYLYNTSGSQWVHLGAGLPQNAEGLPGGETGDITAAAYRDGFVYAFDCQEGYDDDYNTVYTSTFYKLDPKTFEGSALGTVNTKVIALAFNYADGFMYGLTVEEGGWDYVYTLIRVNPATGAIAQVTELDTYSLGVPNGGMAIDYAGNFYFLVEDPNEYEAALVRAKLEDGSVRVEASQLLGGEVADRTGSASMVYSQENHGLLWADEKNTIEWIDLSDWDNLQVIPTGLVGGQSRRTENLGLLTVVSPEPTVPVVAPTQVSLVDESYELVEHDTVQVKLLVEPWNAACTASYAMADETVATVDKNGVITGVKAGETTLTVTVEGLEPLTAKVTVSPDLGSLYGFLLYDYGDGMNGFELNTWGQIPILRPEKSAYLPTNGGISVYAGAYYDGTVYGFGQSGKDYLYYTVKIDPSSFTQEVLAQVDCQIRDMAFDYTTGAMYALLQDDKNVGALAQMDLHTGQLTVIADTGIVMTALACDNEGQLYGADASGGLYKLDKLTAQAVLLNNSSYYGNTYQSMTYDYNNDTIYWAQASGYTGSLVEVDRTTGYTKYLGRINAGGGTVQSNGIETTSLFSVPQQEPQVPAAVSASGVRLPEREVATLGAGLTLKATVLPISVSQVDQTLIWTSSDETVATVSGGVVTPVSTGTVTITAATPAGDFDTCTVTVLDHQRKFYAYDETNTQWVSFDETTGAVTVLRDDLEGEAKLTASVYTGEALYSYDADGYFYSVDPDTFERTKLGDGIHGLTETLQGQDKLGGESYSVEAPYTVVDMTADPATGRLYATLEAYNISPIQDSFMALIVELDPATGAVKEQIMKDSETRPTNLLFQEGKLYFVDGFTVGMLTVIDLEGNRQPVQQAIFAKYWGDFVGGRSLIQDPLTGVVYGIRDLRTEYYDMSRHESVLCRIGLGTASATEICTVGVNIVINGMFIR